MVVVVVSRFVAVPSGVSIFVILRVVVVVSGAAGFASTDTVVDEVAGGGGGVTTVVDAGGAGSLTTVVDDVELGRSHPANAARATTVAAAMSGFMGRSNSKGGVGYSPYESLNPRQFP